VGGGYIAERATNEICSIRRSFRTRRVKGSGRVSMSICKLVVVHQVGGAGGGGERKNIYVKEPAISRSVRGQRFRVRIILRGGRDHSAGCNVYADEHRRAVFVLDERKTRK